MPYEGSIQIVNEFINPSGDLAARQYSDTTTTHTIFLTRIPTTDKNSLRTLVWINSSENEGVDFNETVQGFVEGLTINGNVVSQENENFKYANVQYVSVDPDESIKIFWSGVERNILWYFQNWEIHFGNSTKETLLNPREGNISEESTESLLRSALQLMKNYGRQVHK